MTDSLNNNFAVRMGGRLVLAAAVGFSLIGSAQAQEPKELPPTLVPTPIPVQPLTLAPPQNLAPPVTLEPPKEQDQPKKEEGPSSQVGPATTPPGTGIQVDALSAVDPDSAGTLTIENGGYGAEMWNGTDRALAEWLLSQLPAGTNSPAQRRMMERLLLSVAVPPVERLPVVRSHTTSSFGGTLSRVRPACSSRRSAG